jgi:acyl-CoA synthetase (AMP-forming)/AMP-acid ligase II
MVTSFRAGTEVRAALARAHDRVLLYDLDGASRTGRQLLENVDRLAGALLAQGAERQRIGLFYRNSLSAVEAFLAVEWVGGTRVPVDPNAPPAEANSVFRAADVHVVLADRDHGADVSTRTLIHDDATPLLGPAMSTETAVAPEHTLLLYPRAVQGTTLFSIPVSYANWRATMRINIALYRSGRFGPWLGDQETFLAAQQIMHGTAFVGTFPFLEMGLPQVVADSFDADRILDAIDRHRVTATVLVPPMMSRLVDAALLRPSSGASLKHVIYGGAAVAADEIRRTMRRFGPVLVQGYGRIEGGWPLAILGIEEHRAILAGDDGLALSCGRPIDGVEVKLRPVGDSPSLGELCVTGEMTVTSFADPDGWCSLGDLMRMDESGYLFYRGRLDRMINTGYHVYPSEIEGAIAEVPGVGGVRVSGEPNEQWGASVVADIVLAPGARGEEVLDSVRRKLSSRLARYKIPRRFRIVDRLPA